MGALYKTRPLKSWKKAKELREDYYKRFANIKDEGGFRWIGGAWTFDAIPQGFGKVAHISSEPYGASCTAVGKKFAMECHEACETAGYARDLCSYMRAYWGSVFLNKYAYGGPFPKPDFALQTGICCVHAKWYQVVGEHENIPTYSIDVSAGPYYAMKPHRVQYLVDQSLESIEYLEKILKKRFDDEKFAQAVLEECRGTSLWAECCYLNQAVPAPLDEKSMFSLYVLNTLNKANKEFSDFYEELRDEVKERIADGIAAVPTERKRIIMDSQPPWSFLKLFRYLEDYGVVSVGSLYTNALMGIWDCETQPDGHIKMTPAVTPQQKGTVLKTREDYVRQMCEWNLKKLLWVPFYDPHWKTDAMISLVKDWKCDGVIFHYNRGCEGTAIGNAENRLGILRAGIPVVTYEGNMGDDREFDEGSALARLDAFMEGMNLKKVK